MRSIDARAWFIWLMAGGLLAILIGNPLYLLFLLLISRLVEYACAPAEPERWRLPFWRITLVILLFSSLFNMLTAHVGQTVLFSLPSAWPLVGGPITLEAAVYGFISGFRLVTLLSFFLAFNMIVPVSELAGITPRALHELGLVMLIAITYVPETARQFNRIRDAQAIRGHQFNGLRAWRPVIVPLLISGMERALNLSETMVSRGYGSTTQIATPLRARLLLIMGLMLALGGTLRLAWAASEGWLILGVGIAAIFWAYRDLSRLVSRTRYRPRRRAANESYIVIGALVSLVPLLPLPGFLPPFLQYSPYPVLSMPPFSVWTGLALMGLIIPVVLYIIGREQKELID